jgi:surface carbohydrate biosynthesis protein
MTPVLYISVELKARDLDPRLLVAAEALGQGLHVVFGQQLALSKNIYSVPPGVFLFKTVNEIQATQMVDAKDAGHIVTATDEEVLACGCDACFESGMGPTAAKHLDLFFAQSQRHADIVSNQHAGVAAHVRVTGNPRIDLLSAWGRSSYADAAAAIRDKVGPYVLFNTNFGWINSIWNARENASEIAIRTGHLNPDDPASVAAYESELTWEKDNMEAMEAVLSWMPQGLPDVTAVIRPHPAEDADYWTSKYGGLQNTLVVTGTAHIPWTMAADVLVHTTCSTGLEAALLGTPSISVTPHPQAAQHGYILSNEVNPSVERPEDACAALTQFFGEHTGPITEPGTYAEKLTSMFPDLGGGEAARKIVNEILTATGGANGEHDYAWSIRPGESWVTVERRAEWIEKFSIDSSELAQRLAAMGNLAGLNRAINLQKIDDSLFHIFPSAS